MPWSITIARVAGSEIRIHVTFLLLLAFWGLDGYQRGGAVAALNDVILVIAVFACVVLHELGHALAARRYGIKTPDITVLPIGGLARLSRMPDKPSEEIVIAIAGPLVNVVIAAVLFAVLGIVDMRAVSHVGDPTYNLVAQVAGTNVLLVLFNLIPAFPMDGGRVLRALLALRLDRRRATEIAARIGQGFAILMALWGLYQHQYILVLIALFVFIAAQSESGDVGLMESARHVPVDNAMIFPLPFMLGASVHGNVTSRSASSPFGCGAGGASELASPEPSPRGPGLRGVPMVPPELGGTMGSSDEQCAVSAVSGGQK